MSYRSSYVPYKSNLPTSYKSGTSSAYSSRDDVTSNDLKNTSSPRFAPLASPSAFRPSYSGGTYRSIPIKRDNNYTQYVSRYPSGSNVTDKEKSVEPTKTTSTNKYLGSSTTKDSTPVCNHKISRYSSTSTGNLSRYGQKSRDPSPAIDRRTSPAPLSSTLRARSRDPSPALQDNKLSSSSSTKLNSAINYPTYRMGSRPTSSGYGSNSRYGSNSSSLPRTSATLAERALSYMTTSEMRIRVKQQREKSAERKLREQEATDKEKTLSESTNSTTADVISSIETLEEQNSITTYPSVDIEPEVFIPVKVVTRATSPTPPGSTTFTRTRRLDIAKTIEKIIQRSTRKPIYADKEIQSDRLDDSTKYSRFGSTRMSSCTWSDSSKYSSGKYSGSSATSTPSRTNSRSEIDSIDKSKKDDNSVGAGKTSLNRICTKKENQSKPSSDSSKSSKLSPPKSVTNKQKSTENSTSSSSVARSSLPPTCPKTEASTKTSTSSTTTNSGTKWTNKDFRKSALNVGPTDRPRKSRTPSDSEDNQNKSGSGAAFINGTFQYVQRLERSPSVGSETSNTSTATSSSLSNNTSDNQENINKRCHQPKIKSSPQPNKNSQIPNQIQSQSNEKILVNVLDNKKIFGNDNNIKIESNSGCENLINTDYNVTGKQDKLLSSPPTPPPQTISSTTALFKYLQINSPPIESSSLPSQKQEEQEPLQINSSLKNDDNKNLLIRKLGSVSNFLIARVEQDSDSEQIYFDNNSSSNSISDGLKQNVTTASKANTTIASKLSKKNSSKKNSSNDTSSTNNDKNSITKLPIVELTNNLVTKNTEIGIGCNSSDQNRSSSEKIDIDDFSSGLDTNKQINTDSAFDITDNDMKYKIRHIDSGETAWWMKDNNNIINDDNDDATTIPEDLNSLNQQDEQTSESIDLSSAWWSRHNENSGSSNKSQINNRKLQKQDSNEKPFWWINENDITTKSINSIDKNKSRSNGYNATNNNNNTQDLNSWQKDNYTDNFNINKEQSNTSNIISCLNEPPWYKNTNNTNNNNKYCKNYESSQNSDNKFNNKQEITSNGGISLNKIQRVQSGERPWWLDDTSTNNLKNNQNKNIDKSLSNSDNGSNNGSYKPWYLAGPTKKLLNLQRIESGEKAWWLQENPSVEEKSDNESNSSSSSSDENDDDDDEIHHVINNKPNYQNYNSSLFNQLEIPLGDRASPEGLEDDSSKSRKSPYDNIPSKNNSSDNDKLKQHQQQQQQQQQLTNAEINLQKLFISRHTNIDELLGGSCRPISPILDRIMTKNLFLEEIKPSQVRIHDSTAQMPIIQRMDRDEWDYSARDSMLYDIKQNNLDDAALQVYKDGDFGAYLDLESSLAEQTEEIEGLNSSRKNSIVVRTQLSVRVHAIIEKLLSSEGTELRRALFSLKQIFQEDKDLVHGFVALGGLNCLVRVGNGADQNYQNCILRALGQVMLYVDGMNGVMKHSPTIQWLYSLIASKYRLVVKTALKLLLVFVEYVESNCYLLVNAIHVVDIAQGITPWTNIMKLLKDYDNADTELLIYATSLINKTLSGLSDQDSFYDESDLLEQQGMEGVIQRYMSRPGTDLDLLDQLQLYEAVLKFEDGETDGIRLPDSSVRKTLRYRSTDSTERRKSRRHSTGTSPLNKTVSSPKRFTPNSNGVLDEDSSSSNEFQNNGVFRECKVQRDSTGGITPSLRRRRERNERQKTFMREQQEAAATNGLRSPFGSGNKDEFNGLGQLVTAIPVHLKNTNDSPPDSLILATSTPIKCNGSKNHDDNNESTKLPFSSTKNLLSNTSISVISNGFDKTKLLNGTTNNTILSTSPTKQSDRFNSPNKPNLNGVGSNSPEFLTNKNIVMRSNAINGIMKNIQRNDNNTIKCDQTNENNNINSSSSSSSNNNINCLSSNNHKKFESDSNRLNNYYSQLSSPIKTNILCQKNINNLENSQKHPQNGGSITTTTSPNNCNGSVSNGVYTNGHSTINNSVNGVVNVKKEQQIVGNQNLLKNISQPTTPTASITTIPQTNSQSYNNIEPLCNGNSKTIGNIQYVTTQDLESEIDEKKLLIQLKRDHTVKDLTQKLSSLPTSPQEEKPQNRMGDMTGLISKAKEGLAKSKSKGEISRSPSVDQDIKKSEPKKSENELHWDELVKNISRPLNLCDLDFTDLNSEDEKDVLAPRGLGGGIPPPPPPCGMPPPPGLSGYPPPPKLSNLMPPPPTNLVPPPMYNIRSNLNQNNGFMMNGTNGPAGDSNTIKKNKKTVKLFWKEVREDMIPVTVGKTIWDELPQTQVDIQKLEHLFESRAKDLIIKKQQELNKTKEIIVLDHKRSNAINIAMTKLPPPRAIKAAILKMDATVVTREGIDKLLNMLPTDEERGKIQEAQMSNPELPLGSAEQFLLTLSSISELGARLKLWAFRLDFENSEREIAEPLMDLKQGLELLKQNRTFKCILSTLLSVGIFLNGAPVKGFQIEYLAKVPEVKDTVHKHSLLHHLCHMVMESSPDTTDLYSEIGPITRASKADYTDLAHNLVQLETECKASWDRLKLIAKHDCPTQLKQKLVDFLADCAERIIILQIVHRRVTNRYRKFLLWLGVPQHRVPESRPNEFCRILSEFALEYRTTRERVQQQIEKKANHRERNKTRGKMIIDIPKFRTKEDRADAELKQLLGTPSPTSEQFDNTLTWRRRRAVDQVRSPIIMKQNDEQFTDGDDEILESLVKTATKTSGARPTPRERKRTRHADRKSLRRTLKNGLNDEEKQHVASLIKSY